MFDIGWSEYAVIAVVALIVIGPKELPGVMRMVGQWVGKARKMAGEFQGQFREAMREAEMADLKKSFDDIKEAATGFASGDVMTSQQTGFGAALPTGEVDKPATNETPAISEAETPAPAETTAAAISEVETPATPIPESFTETDAQALASQPLAITQEVEAAPAAQDTAPAASEVLKDAKAS
jgi:sec-independent protein translocase protein TatB